MVPTDNVHIGFGRERTHLQQVLCEIAGILHMASKEKVLHHALHGNLLQVDVTFSLCTLKLVDEQCWENEVVDPVPASGMEASSVQILLYLLKCLRPSR